MTLQGIYAQQVWPEGAEPSRRAMHAAVFEAGWDSEGLLPRHREVIAPLHRGLVITQIAPIYKKVEKRRS